MTNKYKHIVFDLDGTIADINHRLHYLDEDPKNWDAFFAACSEDRPYVPVLKVFSDMSLNIMNIVEIWTGRTAGECDEIFRKTVDWLGLNLFPIKPNVYKSVANTSKDFVLVSDNDFFKRWVMPFKIQIRMRPHGNFDYDHVLKREWLHAARDAGKEIDMVFEDRQSVVDMWAEEGVTCLVPQHPGSSKQITKP